MGFRVPKKAAVCGVLAAALSASMAAHANVVINGGFETKDFSGWTTSINPVWDGVDTLAPQAGAYAAFFGNPSATSTISQTLATVAGTTYDIQFWLMSEPDENGITGTNSFSFDWDGAAGAPAMVDSGAFGYTQFDYQLVASTASTTISFSFSNTPGFWDFDSVDVTAAPSAVPEPASLALAFGALGVLVAVRRRAPAKAEAVHGAG